MKKIALLLITLMNSLLLVAQTDSIVTLPATTIGPFCPKQLVAGDRDFAGRGPLIEASAIVTFSRTTVLATVKFRAKETAGGDNSETQGTTSRILYSAPRGFYISKVEGGSKSEVKFIGKSGSVKFVPMSLAKTLGVNEKSVTDISDGLVAEWEIYGDTEGTDISDDDNCTDDTRIITRLNTLKITLTRTDASLGISTIKLEDINEWLVPSKLVRGDREFGGNGPRIKSEVKLRIGDEGTKLYADVSFWAQETVHDWSTTEGNWSKLVYEAPYGKKITEIVSETASRTQFVSQPARFQIIAPGQDVARAFYAFMDATDIQSAVLAAHGVSPRERSVLTGLISIMVDGRGNTVVKVPPVEGTLVKFFHIVGDTGGPDISHDENGNDDTRIYKIEFFPAKVKMVDAR